MPEELKPAYKQMQAAFTKKTQDLALKTKESETYKTKAEAYGKYEQYIPIIDEMLQGQKGSTQELPELAGLEQSLKQAGWDDNAVALGKQLGQFVLTHFNQTLSQRESQAAFETRLVEAETVDARLNDQSLVYTLPDGTSTTFGEIVAQYAAADPKVRQDPVAATKRAVAMVDALVGKAKTEGKQELSASAKAKALKFPSVTSSSQSAADTSTPMSFAEAAKKAKQELGISK